MAQVDDHLNELKKHIRLKEYPTDHCLTAYKNGYYFEAVGVLHAFLESRMRSILHLFSNTKLKISLDLAWDVNERLSYISLAHVLYVLQLIDKRDYDVLTGLNQMRNEILHRFFFDPYDDFYYGITKRKFHSVFTRSLQLASDFDSKNEQMASGSK